MPASDTQFKKGNTAWKADPEVAAAKKALKDLIGDMLVERAGDFCECWDKLRTARPKEYCEIYLKLLEYKVPKIRSIQLDEETITNPATELLRKAANYKA